MNYLRFSALALIVVLALTSCHMKLDPPGVRAGYSPTVAATVQPTVTATVTPSVRMEKVKP